MAAAVVSVMLAGAVDAGAEQELPSGAAAQANESAPSRFVALTPQRVLDTRDTRTPVGQGGTITVDLSGQTPATAVAVVLNVVGTEGTASTFLTAYPSDQPLPATSNLNLFPGQTRANAVTVALSPDRRVTLYNSVGTTHVVVDIAGYYATDQGAKFTAEHPASRAIDTRTIMPPIGPGGVVDVRLSLPSWDQPKAVVLNVTAVDATRRTVVTAYTSGQPKPPTSNLNVSPGEVVPNQVTVPLDSTKTVRLHNAFGEVHFVVDVLGYYRDGVGSDFVAVTPIRWYDTRPGGAFGLNEEGITFRGFEENVTAVAANLTGTNATQDQHITLWPASARRLATSNLNLTTGQTAANAVTVGVGYSVKFEEYAVDGMNNNSGNVDLIFDVAGFFVLND
ncbi:hypothetical protein [Actinophytocola sp.]|uniref:hypothetical protein n=1 Tax=Actinophytocola sp. TaxID=1872138 RepID=UPI002ED5436B